MADVSPSAKTFTPKQGQYLAFLHLYTRLHRRPLAETDMQEYSRVSPPSVHQMVLTLERAGLIRREPRTPSGLLTGFGLSSTCARADPLDEGRGVKLLE
ncbi:LexA family protein [Bradyrhizobium sp. CCBAU 53415]|uniref:LexA family protein n=1 Tax=Bradyrhizobium sp. CCBAU 53415 TaxID=1325119 RepID=UPI00230669AA|nr:helix-turn-helix domain-containing protein [Bradyrhizobium sp. CCBAU 53415]